MARSGAIQPERGASEGRPGIAADTSTWIAFLQGDNGADVQVLDLALRDHKVVMPPVVITALLSDPKLPPDVARTLCEVRT
jgi:hypothetical protein